MGGLLSRSVAEESSILLNAFDEVKDQSRCDASFFAGCVSSRHRIANLAFVATA